MATKQSRGMKDLDQVNVDDFTLLAIKEEGSKLLDMVAE